MKTRQEMIYDFMLALSSNPSVIPDILANKGGDLHTDEVVYWVFEFSTMMADKYLEEMTYGGK